MRPTEPAPRWSHFVIAPLWFLALAGLLSIGSRATPVQAAGMVVRSGSYTGDGTDDRAITGLGFQPDVVILKGDTGQVGICRISTMVGDVSKSLGGGEVLLANRIQSFNPDGFTIGSDPDVNGSGTSYYWIAFKTEASSLVVGSYTGDGTDDRSITGVGFQPEYVIVMGENARVAWQRSAQMLGDMSIPFRQTGPSANRIQALEADGFQVGFADHVNASGVTYHYAAWPAVAGRVNVGSYTGNGTDNRNITGAGFQPEYVIVKAEAAISGAHRPAALGNGDNTLNFNGSVNFTDGIQALQTDGFQVGTRSEVNQSGTTYYWTAFVGTTPTAIGLIDFAARSTPGAMSCLGPLRSGLWIGLASLAALAVGGLLWRVRLRLF